jgi:hypothetical protein
MDFKLKEHSLIWENYMTNFGSQDEEDGIDPTELPSWINEFDEGDLAAGTYYWASENHSGQSSPGYMALSILSNYYTPGRLSNGPEPESGEAFVYDSIQSENEALAIAEYVKNLLDSSEENSEDGEDVIMSFDTSEPVEIDHDDHNHDDYATTERNDMIRSELAKLVEFANRLSEMSKDADFEEWMAAKITKASDYTSDVYFRLSTKADYANSGCDSEI